MPVLDNYLTVAEAAAQLGVSESAIRQAIMRGQITPTRLGRRVNLISPEQVEQYRAQHLGQWGRGKRKKKSAPSHETAGEDTEHRLSS